MVLLYIYLFLASDLGSQSALRAQRLRPACPSPDAHRGATHGVSRLHARQSAWQSSQTEVNSDRSDDDGKRIALSLQASHLKFSTRHRKSA